MRFFTLFAAIGTVVATPFVATTRVDTPLVPRDATSFSFTDIWQLALYVEHLAIGLYFTAFARFSQQDFTNAGLDAVYYQTLKDILAAHQSQANYIRYDEIGASNPNVKACSYSFPFTDVKSFVAFSAQLESFAASFYLGSIPYLAASSPSVTNLRFATQLAGGAAIIDGQHATFQRLTLKQNITQIPHFPQLGLNESYTYAHSFTKSCPSGKYTLPFTILPTITPNVTNVQRGQVVDFYSTSPSPINNNVYALFLYGSFYTANVILTTGDKPGHFHIKIPDGAYGAVGQTYLLITKYDENDGIDESTVLAGPAVFQISP